MNAFGEVPVPLGPSSPPARVGYRLALAPTLALASLDDETGLAPDLVGNDWVVKLDE